MAPAEVMVHFRITHRNTLINWQNNNGFPRPIKRNGRNVWKRDEVRDWEQRTHGSACATLDYIADNVGVFTFGEAFEPGTSPTSALNHIYDAAKRIGLIGVTVVVADPDAGDIALIWPSEQRSAADVAIALRQLASQKPLS